VTGTSNGIGAATAQLFLSHGAKVAALDVVDEPDATPQSNANLLNIKCDVSSEESVNAAIKQVLDKWSTIDIACNVAGVMDQFERAGEVSNEMWNRVLGVNLNGPLNVMRAVIKHFLTKETEQKGRIVNVGSLASVKGGTAGVAYTTSKHALLGLSRSTSWMYAKEGIQTNILLPGGVATEIMKNSKSVPDKVGLETCMPTMATQCGNCEPIDAANVIVFLAGAVGLNGAEIRLDKGWSAA
jgi:NAD(P)-dependent dehydrogenase (short-subunit alcohol dehydrogenase family)